MGIEPIISAVREQRLSIRLPALRYKNTIKEIKLMIIAATGDLEELGTDLESLWDMIKKMKEPDLLLFAGDMYEYKTPEVYTLFLDFIKMSKWKCPIIAVFGNSEFDEDRDEIIKICKKRITFLEDETIKLKIKNKKVGIVGTEGSLDIPTWWQWRNIPDIKKTYTKRIETIRNLLKGLKTDIRILLMHYAPTYKTLKGEDPRLYDVLGSRKYEKVLTETKPDFVIHGHAHYGIPLAFVDSIPVFNVAISINKKIVEINPEKLPKSGLHKFVR